MRRGSGWVMAVAAAVLLVPAGSRAQGKPDAELQALHSQVQRDGPRAGAALTKALARRTDPMERFALLDLLAQIHHAPALPEMARMLESAPASLDWQRMFVFGKMGPAGVPTLLAAIQSPSRNVRHNAVSLLGWLAAAEAVEPLQKLFWQDEDPELRLLVLTTLEGVTPSIEEVMRFSKEVAARGGKGKASDYAKEAVANAASAREQVEGLRAQKKQDGAAFRREHRRLMDSAGKEGDYNALLVASTARDEAALQELRERILQRGSDEAFDDYAKVSQIIVVNRLIAGSGKR